MFRLRRLCLKMTTVKILFFAVVFARYISVDSKALGTNAVKADGFKDETLSSESSIVTSWNKTETKLQHRNRIRRKAICGFLIHTIDCAFNDRAYLNTTSTIQTTTTTTTTTTTSTTTTTTTTLKTTTVTPTTAEPLTISSLKTLLVSRASSNVEPSASHNEASADTPIHSTSTDGTHSSATKATSRTTRILTTSGESYLPTFSVSNSTATESIQSYSDTHSSGTTEIVPQNSTSRSRLLRSTTSRNTSLVGTTPSFTSMNTAKIYSDAVIFKAISSTTNSLKAIKTIHAASTTTVTTGATALSSSPSHDGVRLSPGFFESASNIIIVCIVVVVFILFAVMIVIYFCIS